MLQFCKMLWYILEVFVFLNSGSFLLFQQLSMALHLVFHNQVIFSIEIFSDRQNLNNSNSFVKSHSYPVPYRKNSTCERASGTMMCDATCAPAKLPEHPGERLADFFHGMFKTVAAISTLGASLTFSKVVSNPTEPWVYHGLSGAEIQTYVADAFVCFTLNLFLTTLAASALSYYQPQAIRYFSTEESHQRRFVA